MQFRPPLLALAVAGAALFTGCKKQSPAPKASFAHAYTFSTLLGITPPQSEHLQQPAQQLSGSARLTAAALELTVNAAATEQLAFSIPREQLHANLGAQYQLNDPSGSAGPASVAYTYYLNDAAGRQARLYHNRPATGYPTSGWLHITQYDARRELISGTYHVHFSFVPDPKGSTPNGAPDRQIELQGSFEDVPLPQ